MTTIARRDGARWSLAVVAALAAGLLWAGPARALDTDIFTGTQVNPNVLLVFDNSGSMGSMAYNTWPGTVYSGTATPGTIYTRCANKGAVSGGNVNLDCSCKTTQTNWVVDQSACASTTWTDDVPPPSGDDIDDRESRRMRGNRRNFNSNPPKFCKLAPFGACTSNGQCPGTGNQCLAQNKLAVAKSVVTSLVNDPANANLRFGLVVFNPPGIDYGNANYDSTTWVTNWQANNNVYQFPLQDMTSSARASLTSIIGGLTAEGATPTTHRLIDSWKYFNGQATKTGFTTSPVQHTCQRNYMLMVTDGIPEVEADRNFAAQTSCTFNRIKSFVGNPGDLNSDGKENPASPNWLPATGESYNCGSDYLDDAMYKVRGLFPLGNSQNQPVALYALSFGFDYCEAPAAGDTYPGAGSLLWRASKKYGGGDCFSAIEPDELDEALREALNVIKNDAQSFVAPVVPVSQTNRTESGDRLYVALFSPRQGQSAWPGNLKKYALNRNAGTICNASTPTCTSASGSATTSDGTLLGTAESFWDSGTGGPSGNSVTSGGVGAVLLASDLSTRKIYTYTGTATGDLGGVNLAGTELKSLKGTLTNAAKLGLPAADQTVPDLDGLIDYVYGYDSYDEDADSVLTEKRSWILGDIVHSVPLIVNYDSTGNNAAVFLGANDGMLHAFDDATGQELWAFVPPDLLPSLNNLRPGEVSTHPFFVDASPKVKVVTDTAGNVTQRILVFGLGRGGRAYYGLDVTSKSSPKLLWRVNNATAGFAELGYTLSTPALTRYDADGPGGTAPVNVAIVGGGLDTWFDDPAHTGTNASGYGRTLYFLNLANGSKIAFTPPSGMDYPIPSDPLAFDVNGDGIFDRAYVGDLGGNLWRINFDLSGARLFSAGGNRKIFYAPDAVVNSGSVMVYFGTGDRTNPMTTTTQDRFYAIRDDGLATNLGEGNLENVTNQVVQPYSSGESSSTASARNALLNKIIPSAANNYSPPKSGWMLQLTGSGEKVLAPATVFFNVAFSTFTPSTVACEAGGSARLYVVDPFVGGPTTDLAGTSGGGLGGGVGAGGGVGSGAGGLLDVADRFSNVGNSIPTSLKVTFGDDETKAFFGVTKGGGIALQPLNLPQIASNVIPVSWRQSW